VTGRDIYETESRDEKCILSFNGEHEKKRAKFSVGINIKKDVKEVV
jgi:hypothetical protein